MRILPCDGIDESHVGACSTSLAISILFRETFLVYDDPVSCPSGR